MNATDVVTSKVGTGHIRTGTIDDVANGATGTGTGDRLVGASPGSLAFQAGYLASGLGWHASLPTFRSTASDEYSHLLEACR